jgi:hypothetical protein
MDLPEREHRKSDKKVEEYIKSESRKLELSIKDVEVRNETRM